MVQTGNIPTNFGPNTDLNNVISLIEINSEALNPQTQYINKLDTDLIEIDGEAPNPYT